MIPIKDIIPPRTTPIVAIGILVLGSLAFLIQAWLGFAVRQNIVFFITNVVALWIFADNVEDRMGHWRFGLFYTLCHAASTIGGALVDPTFKIPVGLTNGAVAGVIGAYFVLYPRSRVLMWFPLPSMLFEVPAGFFLGLFFVLHATGGASALAELGAGLSAGALLCVMLKRPLVW